MSKVVAFFPPPQQLSAPFYVMTSFLIHHCRHVAHDRYALKDLETIDDDLDKAGITLVRVADENAVFAEKYEIDMVPALILFHEGRPYQFKGEVTNEEEAVKWFKKKLASFDEL